MRVYVKIALALIYLQLAAMAAAATDYSWSDLANRLWPQSAPTCVAGSVAAQFTNCER